MDGPREAASASIEVLFEPSARVSLANVKRTKDRVLLETLDNVKSRTHGAVAEGRRVGADRDPDARPRHRGPDGHDDDSETFFFTYEDFTTPDSLWLTENGGAPAKVKTMPAFFDATGMTTDQLEATSKDGTKIPYFVVRPRGTKADGTVADASLRIRRLRNLHRSPTTAASSAARGSRAEASTSSPTSAAAASSAPPGTRPR